MKATLAQQVADIASLEEVPEYCTAPASGSTEDPKATGKSRKERLKTQRDKDKDEDQEDGDDKTRDRGKAKKFLQVKDHQLMYVI